MLSTYIFKIVKYKWLCRSWHLYQAKEIYASIRNDIHLSECQISTIEEGNELGVTSDPLQLSSLQYMLLNGSTDKYHHQYHHLTSQVDPRCGDDHHHTQVNMLFNVFAMVAILKYKFALLLIMEMA